MQYTVFTYLRLSSHGHFFVCSSLAGRTFHRSVSVSDNQKRVRAIETGRPEWTTTTSRREIFEGIRNVHRIVVNILITHSLSSRIHMGMQIFDVQPQAMNVEVCAQIQLRVRWRNLWWKLSISNGRLLFLCWNLSFDHSVFVFSLQKNRENRARYPQLLETEFLTQNKDNDIAEFANSVISHLGWILGYISGRTSESHFIFQVCCMRTSEAIDEESNRKLKPKVWRCLETWSVKHQAHFTAIVTCSVTF